MGHIRLGRLPDTAPWRHVVGLVAGGADVAAVAAATTEAAQHGLKLARGDGNFLECLWALLTAARAAKADDFKAALLAEGIKVEGDADVLGLVSAVSERIDAHFRTHGPPGHVGEMGRLAAAEALTHLLQDRSAGLFGTTPREVQAAARSLSHPAGFGTLVSEFFGRFLSRFLAYHLGRELANHVGGNGRFTHPKDHAAFLERLGTHCREAAGRVHDFAAGWLGKAEQEQDVTRGRAMRFVAHALKKLHAEVRDRGGRAAVRPRSPAAPPRAGEDRGGQ